MPFVTSSYLLLVASLLVVWPGDTGGFLLLVVSQGTTSSFLLLVVWQGATSGFLLLVELLVVTCYS